MKSFLKKIFEIFVLCLFFCFFLIYPQNSIAGVDLPWSTTYDCDAWTQSDGLYNVNCDGLTGHGGWTCKGDEEQITSAANYPGGDGGKGQRHWEGDGSNVNSGSLRVPFNSVQTEFWIRWYMRYEAGFKWGPLQYDKILYIFTEHSSTNGNIAVIPAWYGSNRFDLEIQGVQGGIHYHSNDHGWTDTMGGSSADGQFHCYEIHLKMDTNGSNGICEAWIDGQQIISFNNCDLGTQTGSGWTWFLIGENQYSPNNGRNMYVDYDDIAVSNTGYIGPISGGSDTIPPSVSISSPTPGQTVSGILDISASASDNVGVAGVQFKIDGNDVGAEDVTSPYSISLDTTAFSDGSHTLTATARDAAGNQATSSPVSVTISNGGSDTIPPSVSISSPTPGQTVSGILAISASASDNVGVAGVQFKIDGNDVGAEDATSPYSIFLDTTVFSDGSHTLTATARDAAGNQATSSPVSVTISNGGGGTALFEESFEDGNFAARGWYDNTNLQLSNSVHIPGSASSVEFHFNQGATSPTSGGAIRKKFTETEKIYVSYFVKYSLNWEGSNRSYHPHEFYLLTNENGDWTGLAYTHLTAYIEQNEGEPLISIQDGQNIDESNIDVDLTNITEQRSVAGCNGDSDGYGDGLCYSVGSVHWNDKLWRAGSMYFQDNPGQYYKNDWHFIEAYIRLNSISSGKGVADGVIQYWYDGELIIDHSDVVLRTGQHPNMKFNQFVIAPWIGDGSPVNQTFWVDNLTVATSRPSGSVPTSPPNFEVN